MCNGWSDSGVRVHPQSVEFAVRPDARSSPTSCACASAVLCLLHVQAATGGDPTFEDTPVPQQPDAVIERILCYVPLGTCLTACDSVCKAWAAAAVRATSSAQCGARRPCAGCRDGWSKTPTASDQPASHFRRWQDGGLPHWWHPPYDHTAAALPPAGTAARAQLGLSSHQAPCQGALEVLCSSSHSHSRSCPHTPLVLKQEQQPAAPAQRMAHATPFLSCLSCSDCSSSTAVWTPSWTLRAGTVPTSHEFEACQDRS
jgi:hypothetical protein